MPSTQQQERLADRLEALIEKEPDPQQAMREVAQAFAAAGLILDEEIVQSDVSWMFVMHVMTDNPLMGDWLNLRDHLLKQPGKIRTLSEFLTRMLYNERAPCPTETPPSTRR